MDMGTAANPPPRARFRRCAAKPCYRSRDAALRQGAAAQWAGSVATLGARRAISYGKALAPRPFLGFNLNNIG